MLMREVQKNNKKETIESEKRKIERQLETSKKNIKVSQEAMDSNEKNIRHAKWRTSGKENHYAKKITASQRH